jgi:protoporphyrinogen oxidase
MSEQTVVNRCLDDMVRTGMFKSRPHINGCFSIFLEKAYPIFEVGWQEKFAMMYESIKNIKGLFTIGRKGLFLHCNIDHCIIQARELAEFILRTGGETKGHELDARIERYMKFSARD